MFNWLHISFRELFWEVRNVPRFWSPLYMAVELLQVKAQKIHHILCITVLVWGLQIYHCTPRLNFWSASFDLPVFKMRYQKNFKPGNDHEICNCFPCSKLWHSDRRVGWKLCLGDGYDGTLQPDFVNHFCNDRSRSKQVQKFVFSYRCTSSLAGYAIVKFQPPKFRC